MNKLFSFFGLGAEDVPTAIYGEPGNGSEHSLDPVIFQGYDSTCAIRSQQIILRDFGVDISQEQLIGLAEQNGWFSEEDGTPMGYVGHILQTCGVGVHQQMNCTVYDLANELAQGHRIIVGVDADELWHDGFMGLKGDWNDLVHGEEANHALIVAGIEVNPNDPDDVKVVLTDPGTGDHRIEYPLDKFMDAWQDSDCFMVATNETAPYQYDPATGCEVPSNLYTEAFIENNSYPLSADDIMIPEGYLSAHYGEGHLDSILMEGHDIDFEDFQEALIDTANALQEEEFNPRVFEETLFDILGIEVDDLDVFDAIDEVEEIDADDDSTDDMAEPDNHISDMADSDAGLDLTTH